jgi:hypothetical protein
LLFDYQLKIIGKPFYVHLTFENTLKDFNLNFTKVKCFGQELYETYSQIFSYGMMGQNPFRHLDILINHRKLSNNNCKVVEEHFPTNQATRKGNFIYGGRQGMINSVLSNLLAIHVMIFFELTKGILNKLLQQIYFLLARR